MTKILFEKFIQNKTDDNNAGTRRNVGVLAGITGILCNVFLFVIKLISGLLTGHISIIADAVNNLSDMASCIVMLVGFKAVGKPADSRHPFGHGRTEYIAGQVVSFAIIFMGITLIRESVEKIISPSISEITVAAIIILGISIAVKLWMWHFYKAAGRRIGSQTIIAASRDSLNDVIATSAVFVTMIIEMTTGVRLDGIAGIGVAIFIIISGIISCKETMDPLLGKMPSKETLKKIEEAVKYDNRILGVHDIVVHDYGPGQMYCTLHAEVPSDMSIIRAHEAAHAAEKRVTRAVGCETMIHIDPVAENDMETKQLSALVTKVVHTVDSSLKIHDFQVLKHAPNPKVSFDVVISDEKNTDCDAVRRRIERALSEWAPELTSEITIDRLFVHSQKMLLIK